ncbi:hypothetical protein MNBD_GAMMA25-2019 [hydrothermal vent metagenome]|uniref:Sel1 repeat family protein n=1 Tax=hydrothermal vent metagenome TaxID=652676 RepID=A0A3B1B501_9ZZZZ
MRSKNINLPFSFATKKEVALFYSLGLVLIALLMQISSSAQAGVQSTQDSTSGKSLDSSLLSQGQEAVLARRSFIAGAQAYKEKDFYRAERIWLPLAHEGHSSSQFFLGVLYESASNDQYKAVHWYKQAAEQGNKDAQHNLGLAYARGQGVKKDASEAVKWWRSAGMQGNSDSQYNLGIIYATGATGVSQNFREAKRWWLLAAANGDALAQYNLGAMYANGVAGKQSYCEAVRWWSRSQSNGFRQADIALENLGEQFNGLNCH